VSSSTRTEAGEQAVELADLFSQMSELATQEEKELGRVMSTVVSVLAYVNEPIALRPRLLGESFREIKEASLRPGAVVVTTDLDGNVASTPLARFATSDCVAILRDSVPELQRLMHEKKRAILTRPTLSMKVHLSGTRLILDTRGYRLVVSNSGGDCKGLEVSVELPDGETRQFRPRDLSRGGRIEFDIVGYKELSGADRIKLRFDCEDVDGREFRGEYSLLLGVASFQETPMVRKNRA
jgi:hypothetical protein